MRSTFFDLRGRFLPIAACAVLLLITLGLTSCSGGGGGSAPILGGVSSSPSTGTGGGNGGGGGNGSGGALSVTVIPAVITLLPGNTEVFDSTSSNTPVTWTSSAGALSAPTNGTPSQ